MCLEGHWLSTLLLQGTEGAPRAHRHQGSHEKGIKESTKQLVKPPQWSGVGMTS